MVDNLWGIPKVGGDILSFCSKCKMELAHVIVSMVDRHPAKVICKTCKSQHSYKRGGAQRTEKPSRQPRKVQPRASIGMSKLWEQKVAENKKPTVDYDARRQFKSGEVISHSMFGVGVVEEIKGRKMIVLFRQGEKVLIHGQP